MNNLHSQGKFFINRLKESRKSQIRGTFNTAIFSKDFKLKEWILCIPIGLTIDEHKFGSDCSRAMALEHFSNELIN